MKKQTVSRYGVAYNHKHGIVVTSLWETKEDAQKVIEKIFKREQETQELFIVEKYVRNNYKKYMNAK